MYKLKTSASFDSAHFLSNYVGKCANIHGHRWTIEVEIFGNDVQDIGQEKGMVTDFGVIKKDVKNLADSFDHALIIEKNSLKENTLNALKEEKFNIIEMDFRTTAENFAKYFYNELQKLGHKVYQVSVYETPNNVATYSEN